MQSGKQEPWPRGINLPRGGTGPAPDTCEVSGGGALRGEGQARRTRTKYCSKVGRGRMSSPAAAIPSTMASLLSEGDGKL